METEPKRTRMPWFQGQVYPYDIYAKGAEFVDFPVASVHGNGLKGPITNEQAQANAAFIVRAVNAHEEYERLLESAASAFREACVGTNAFNDTCGVTFTCSRCRRAGEIEQAIAKAEKGA